MKAHWATHKSACKEAHALRRAAETFTEIWFEKLKLTNGGVIASVSEEDGLIEAKMVPMKLSPGKFQPVSRHLAASEEQVLACVSAGSCGAVIETGSGIFEVLIHGEEAQF